MASFKTEMLGGPMDGQTHDAKIAPREGDRLAVGTPRRTHLYEFRCVGAIGPRWVYVGIKQQQPAL